MNLIKQCTKIAREHGFSLMAAQAAVKLITHVNQGGFVGCNADHYAMADLNKDGKLIKSGYDLFTDEQRREAYAIAEILDSQFWAVSQDNFNRCSDVIDDEGDMDDWQASYIWPSPPDYQEEAYLCGLR